MKDCRLKECIPYDSILVNFKKKIGHYTVVLNDAFVYDITIEIGINVITIKIKEVEKNYGSGNLEKRK